MYLPAHYEERDPAVLHALVRSHPLSTWVVQGPDGLIVNHIPFLLDATSGTLGTLVGHVARPNPVWKQCLGTLSSVAIFQGPEHYISPSWYPTKEATGKAVPTWNYVVVHAHGVPRVFDDRKRLLAHVTALTDTHEAGHAVPWRVSDAPPDYIDAMLRGIVGIEIPIGSLVGKWKVSQNRPPDDRRAVALALQQFEDDRSRAMAAEVEQRLRDD
jgi:transcriptional regulator